MAEEKITVERTLKNGKKQTKQMTPTQYSYLGAKPEWKHVQAPAPKEVVSATENPEEPAPGQEYPEEPLPNAPAPMEEVVGQDSQGTKSKKK